MKKDLGKIAREAFKKDAAAAKRGGQGFIDRVFGGSAQGPEGAAMPLTTITRAVPLSNIKPDLSQPRKTIEPEALEQLAESIRVHGILQPITVYWSDADKTYILITGERRFRAAQKAGLQAIPAIIRPAAPDEQIRLQHQLVENIQRENLPPIEEARAVKTLMESFNLTQQAVAKKIGKPLTYVAELLAILRLPEERLSQGQGLGKHALIELAKVREPQKQQQALERMLHSETPLTEIRRIREKDPKARERRRVFKVPYRVPGFRDTVMIAFHKDPENLGTEYVVRLLRKLIETVSTKEKTSRKGR